MEKRGGRKAVKKGGGTEGKEEEGDGRRLARAFLMGRDKTSMTFLDELHKRRHSHIMSIAVCGMLVYLGCRQNPMYHSKGSAVVFNVFVCAKWGGGGKILKKNIDAQCLCARGGREKDKEKTRGCMNRGHCCT
jgi:hypothetical protein